MSEADDEQRDFDDKVTSERIIIELYAHIRRPPPMFLWFDDPVQCHLACNLLPLLGFDVDWSRLWSWSFEPLEFKIPKGGLVPQGMWSELDGFLLRDMPNLTEHGSRTWHTFWGQLEQHTGAVWGRQMRETIRRVGIDEVRPLGGHFARQVRGFWGGVVTGGAMPDAQGPAAVRLAALQGSCGWWFPYSNAVVCAHRPRIHFDQRDRLHNERGPALELSSDRLTYAWHGTRVPAQWIEQRDTLDPSTALTWPDLEQRRAAAQIIGWAKVLEQLPTHVIHTDRDPQIGTLLECVLPGELPSRFLRVRCGTGREFALRVPVEMTTARQANAWTYGLEAHEYQLEART